MFANDVMVILTFTEGCYDDMNATSSASKKKPASANTTKNGVFVTAKMVPIDFIMSDILGSVNIDVDKVEDASAFETYYGENECIVRSKPFYFDTHTVTNADDTGSSHVRGVSVPLRFGMFDNCIVDSVDQKLYETCSSLDHEMAKHKDMGANDKEIAEKKGNISEAYDWHHACVYDTSKRAESSDDCICHKNCYVFSPDQTKKKVSCTHFGKYNVVFCGSGFNFDGKKTIEYEDLWHACIKHPEEIFSEDERMRLNYYKNYGKWFLSKCKVSGDEHPTSKWRSKINEVEKKILKEMVKEDDDDGGDDDEGEEDKEDEEKVDKSPKDLQHLVNVKAVQRALKLSSHLKFDENSKKTTPKGLYILFLGGYHFKIHL
jgi:hypothetical protein